MRIHAIGSGMRGDQSQGPTDHTENLIPNRELATLPDCHNDTETISSHDRTELNWRGIGPLLSFNHNRMAGSSESHATLIKT